jgi:hypothetical protein
MVASRTLILNFFVKGHVYTNFDLRLEYNYKSFFLNHSTRVPFITLVLRLTQRHRIALRCIVVCTFFSSVFCLHALNYYNVIRPSRSGRCRTTLFHPLFGIIHASFHRFQYILPSSTHHLRKESIQLEQENVENNLLKL